MATVRPSLVGPSGRTQAPAIVFAGLAKDCKHGVRSLLDWLSEHAQSGRYWAVVGENGSTDGTREVLEESPFVTVVDTSEVSAIPNRFLRMARARELVREQVASRFNEAELVCVIDLDGDFLRFVSPQILFRQLATLRDRGYFAVGATSYPRFYDLLALEEGGRRHSHIIGEFRRTRARPIARYKFMKREIFDVQDAYTRMGSFRCESSFNGLVVYPREFYVQGTYSGARPDECEHLAFHETIRNATRLGYMLVSDVLVVPTPIEHVRMSLLANLALRFTRWSRDVTKPG